MGTAPATLLALGLAVGQPTASSDRGLPVGEKSRIHAGVRTQIMYDSNVDRLDRRENPNDLSGEDGRFVVSPSLELDVPGRSFGLNLLGAADVSHRFGLSSRPERTTLGFRGSINSFVGSEQSFAQLRLQNELIRSPAILSEPGTIGADEQVFRSWTNIGQLAVEMRPGSGALTFEIAYRNRTQFFDDPDPLDDATVPLALTDSSRHDAFLELRYAFLPRTELFFNGALGFFIPSSPEVGGAPRDTLRAAPLELEAGAIGQVTRRISAEVALGYGNTLVFDDDFFSNLASDANQSTLTARARLNYAFSQTAGVSAGFRRSVAPLIRVKSAIRNIADIRANVMIATRLNLSALASYEYREYGETAADGADLRSNTVIADAGFEYFVLDWLSFGGRYRLLWQETNEGTIPLGGTPLLGQFERHQIIGTVRATY